jgi:hypothetical protein
LNQPSIISDTPLVGGPSEAEEADEAEEYSSSMIIEERTSYSHQTPQEVNEELIPSIQELGQSVG